MKKRALALIVGAFGLLLLVFGLYPVPEQISSQSWPEVRGMMLRSEVKKHSGRKKSRDYRLNLIYEYQVAGKTYQGKRQAITRVKYEMQGQANEALQRYAAGLPVQIHYNPENPERSVLEPGIRFKDLRVIFFGGVLLALAVGLWFYLGRESLNPMKMGGP